MNKGEALANFLEERGVRLNRSRMGWQKVRCYGPGHSRGDREPSMTVNLSTGYCRCWACDLTDNRSVDAIHLLQAEQSLTYKEALTTLGVAKSPQDSEVSEVWL